MGNCCSGSSTLFTQPLMQILTLAEHFVFRFCFLRRFVMLVLVPCSHPRPSYVLRDVDSSFTSPHHCSSVERCCFCPMSSSFHVTWSLSLRGWFAPARERTSVGGSGPHLQGYRHLATAVGSRLSRIRSCLAHFNLVPTPQRHRWGGLCLHGLDG